MKLSAEARRGLRRSTFGMPAERKYPMPDRQHAVLAKAYSTQQYNKGNLSAAQMKAIHAKANRKLGLRRG